MATTVQFDIQPLYELHAQLLELDERLDDPGREATPVERQIAESLRSIGQRMIDLVEDVLDSQESRLAMEDVRDLLGWPVPTSLPALDAFDLSRAVHLSTRPMSVRSGP